MSQNDHKLADRPGGADGAFGRNVMNEADLLARLSLVEALHSGAATAGEKDAAAQARDRIRARLAKLQTEDPPIEYSFSMSDVWSRQLFVALLRRYDIKPYRYARQRRTTVRARLPRRFLNETLWPTFLELNRLLRQHLAEVTERVVSQAIATDTSEAEERAGSPPALTEMSGPTDEP